MTNAEAGAPGRLNEGRSPAVDVRDLEVTFRRRGRDLPVLKGVSLEIAAGEAYGLVGESGCGKSTLALSILRYLASNGRVERGAVHVDGRDVETLSDEELRKWRGEAVAMVYQDPATALSPAMRIGDQVAEVFRFHQSITKDEARDLARESLRKVALPDPDAILRRYPFELSGGQQQRVVIAMALAANPRLLILDEPTTGLDATVEAEILDLIEDLRGRIHAAILLITHNLGLVARLCERVGVMYAGRLVEEGPAREVFTDPRHPYTMGLLRCVPRFGMNKTDAALQTIPGTLPALGEPLSGCVYSARCPMAQPVCSRREPDLYAWPGLGGELGRAAAEAAPADPAAYSPHHSARVGAGQRHARCYFSADVPRMIVETPALWTAREQGEERAEDVLEVDTVRRSFKDGRKKLVAVRDVSLQLKRGETLGLVGESGSGKTTLAKCVTGLIAPDTGSVSLSGYGLLKPTANRRSKAALRAIQMVFQNPDSTLNPSWTTRAILTRAVKKLGGNSGSPVRAKVDKLAADVRVEPRFLLQKPTDLSGGQKQRIAIARAFAGEPTLVVCDEPASALDVSVQASILNLLVELQASEAVSYVFISHDLAVVRYISDRIGVMYLAELIELGSADQVFSPPHHPYTEALLSSIPTLDFDDPHERIPLRGSMPSLSDPPTGCRFHTRCHRFLGELCVQEEPPFQEAAAGHVYKCHIPPDELLAAQASGDPAPPVPSELSEADPPGNGDAASGSRDAASGSTEPGDT